MLTGASGVSSIMDEVWRDRFAYAAPMDQVGARLEVRSPSLRIHQVEPAAAGQRVTVLDLHSAAALVVAALGVRGATIIDGAEHLERGYQDFVPKLERLGAIIQYCW